MQRPLGVRASSSVIGSILTITEVFLVMSCAKGPNLPIHPDP